MRVETGGLDKSRNWRLRQERKLEAQDWRLETRMQTMMTRAERNNDDDEGRKQQ